MGEVVVDWPTGRERDNLTEPLTLLINENKKITFINTIMVSRYIKIEQDLYLYSLRDDYLCRCNTMDSSVPRFS